MATEQFTIRLGLNSSGVTSGVNAAIGQIGKVAGAARNMVQGFLALQVVSFGTGIIKSSMELASNLTNVAKRSGTSVESLQELQYAGEKVGATFDDIVDGIKKISVAQIEAIRGNRAMQEVFSRYGISVKDLTALNSEQLFRRFGDAVGKAPVTSLVNSDVKTVLGNVGETLLPAFRDGFSDATKEAQSLGLVIKKNITDELERASSELELLNKKFKVTMATITGTAIQNLRLNLRTAATTLFAGKVGAELTKQGLGPLGPIISRAILGMEEARQLEELTGKTEEPPKPPTDVQPRENPNAFKAPSGDSLSRIGLYRGGTPSGELMRIPQQQLVEQQKTNVKLDTISKGQDANTKAIQSLNNVLGIIGVSLKDDGGGL